MSRTVPAPSAFPRRDGEPEVDLAGYQAVHRALLTDLAELTAAVDRVRSAGGSPSGAGASSFATYVRELCTVTRDHLDWEDRAVWPLLASSAGPAVDLSDLTDDHAVLAPLLARARSTSAALADSPGDGARLTALAGGLAELHDLLAEHVADEEAMVLPAVRRYVSVGDYRRAERASFGSATPAHRVWLLGWLDHHDAGAALAGAGLAGGLPGAAPRVALPVARAAFRRRRAQALTLG